MSKESEAIKAEVEAEDDTTEPKPVEFEFDGHTYAILVDQPSPKALEHLAEYAVNDSRFHALLFVRTVIGQAAWDLWCERHKGQQVTDMLYAANEAYTGN